MHFHLLVPDGVFVDDDDRLAFALHPVPTSVDVLAIFDRIVRRIARRLADEARDDGMEEGVDVFAQVQAEAAATWRSPRNGEPTVRGVERLRAWCEGFSLHADVVIADHDREALERLCRYGARPAFTHERLTWTADGQIAYRLKRPWPDGRTELVPPPVAFLRRLCGIIPPPRRHLVRYAGVFGPASKRRAQLRALVPAPAGEPPQQPSAAAPSGSTRAGRIPWAELLRRVFATDVLSCPCGGRRSVVAVVVDAAMARAVLAALGLPCTPATFAPARDPPQTDGSPIEALDGRASIGPDGQTSGELQFLLAPAKPHHRGRCAFEWDGASNVVGKVTRVDNSTGVVWEENPLRATIAPDRDGLRIELWVAR